MPSMLAMLCQPFKHQRALAALIIAVATFGQSPEALSLSHSSGEFLERRPLFNKASSSAAPKHSQSCVPLHNHGTHSTVEISLGTPPQKFDVIADTGSSALVVRSCTCELANGCNEKDRCFKGSGKSSTFSINMTDPPQLFLSYGSGDIEAVVATDVVAVGDVSTVMQDALVLMTSNDMFFSLSFEGILGLGIPAAEDAIDGPNANASVNGSGVTASNTTGSSSAYPNATGMYPGSRAGSAGEERSTAMHNINAVVPGAAKLLQAAATTRVSERNIADDPPTFLEFAGIDRFSLCLNDNEEGMLKLGTTPAEDEQLLGSVGRLHWGVDFRGISIGDKDSPVLFCDEDSMLAGQETPCAGIPDSGTTMITAPAEQLAVLFESICDQWPRCSANYSSFDSAQQKVHKVAEEAFNGSVPWDLFNITKAQVFQSLLQDCGSWLTEDSSLDDELPPLHFHIRGSEGGSQTVMIRGWAYVMEMNEESPQDGKPERPGEVYVRQEESSIHLHSNSGDGNPDNIAKETFEATADGKEEEAQQMRSRDAVRKCEAAFGTMDYYTTVNGPVWIFGTSFFYDYDITFNLGTSPPSMAFTSLHNQGCGSCEHGTALGQQSGQVHRRVEPRRLNDPPRRPRIDKTKPL